MIGPDWKLVPATPTREMLFAGAEPMCGSNPSILALAWVKKIYDSTLAAAPPSPSPSSIPTEEEIKAVIERHVTLRHGHAGVFYTVGEAEAARAILKLLAEKGEK